MIEEIEDAIRNDQKRWLQFQTNLVELSEKRSHQLNDILLTRKSKIKFHVKYIFIQIL